MYSSSDLLSFTWLHFFLAGDYSLQSQSQSWKCNQKWTQSRSMLVAENSMFVVRIACRILGCWRDRKCQWEPSIDLTERQMDVMVWKRSKHVMLGVASTNAVLQLLRPCRLCHQRYLDCLNSLSFTMFIETFAHPNNTECFFTLNALIYEEVGKVSTKFTNR